MRNALEMTQVESGKEEGAQPTKCDQGSDSGPSSHNEVTINKKSHASKMEACSLKKPSGELNTSSPLHNMYSKSRVGLSPRTLKVYKNGESQESQDFVFQKDSKNAKTWSGVLDMLSVAVSSKHTENFNVAKVFTTQGRKVLSASDLECCSEIVVCGAEPYQSIQYGSFVDTTYHRRSPQIIKQSKMRRSERDSIVKSVILEPPTSMVEEITTNSANRKHHHHHIVKTLSEQDVSNLDSVMTDSMSPKMRTRNIHSPKPRPVSAYHQVASVHGVDRRTPVTPGLVSRIPKRIVANNNNRGSIHSVNSVNYTLSNNNMNARISSNRKAPVVESKTSSERTSRHGMTFTIDVLI